MVGPNFRSPHGPKTKNFTESPLPTKTAQSPVHGGEAQAFLTNKDIPLLWWELFHSVELNQLVRMGIARNPDLASAAAAIRQAQENLNVQFGNKMLPAFDGVGVAQRQRYSTLALGGLDMAPEAMTFNLFNVAVNVSYTVDVWGGARRGLEALRAKVDYQQFQLIAAYLTLTANIVTTAVSIASYNEQIAATIQLIKAQQDLLIILQKQFKLGGVSSANVLRQQTLVEQSKATLPELQKKLSQAKHALSALVGNLPNCPLPEIRLANLKLPQKIPVSLPSMLIRQRPDVRASESLLHAACAQIGVATANLLPQLNITGYYGWIGNNIGNLITPANNIWSIMSQVTQPIFHGGALLAQRRADIAAFDQAAAQYRQTVLQAFKNVADVLRALETDARTLQAQASAEDSARRSLQLILGQYRLGGADYINLLDAQQQYQKTVINRIQAQASRYNDTAALFQALGGGWWHKPWCVKECI